ncbi:hypothetical protein COCOBI_11-5320 [Coccomyxa sp. Obi]|nr:hypothetical protein COCOBI_11-5320 [Coccomyxa sp. Obi]
MGAPKTLCHSYTALVVTQFVLSVLILSRGTKAFSAKRSLQRKNAIFSKVFPAEEQASDDTSEKPLVGRLQLLMQQERQDPIQNKKYYLDDGRRWGDLPRLAWVVSQSPERLGNWSLTLSALNCYCALHSIPLFIETETFIQDSRLWFYRRLGNVQKYLPHFQWVLHTDLDVLPVNYSVAATDFLDDNFDLILQDRVAPSFSPNNVLGTPEIHSSAYFVKNSGSGKKFMQRWLSSSDNGRSDVLDQWGHVTPETYRTYLQCFRTHLKAAMAEDVAESPWYRVDSSGGIAEQQHIAHDMAALAFATSLISGHSNDTSNIIMKGKP